MSANNHSPATPFADGRSVTELFHRLNSVVPFDQSIVSVSPDTPARDALELLRKHGFSQVPVVIGQQVLGVFSYRSFSETVITQSADSRGKKHDPQELYVDECIAKPTYARVTDELRTWFDAIDREDAILVGDPNRLQAIVTAMDMLRYLYDVASPFVLIAEIELSLRALIRRAVDPETLVKCSATCLKHYTDETLPTRLEEMTFNDYVQLVGDGRNWQYFQPVFMGNRASTRAKLEQVRDLRNDVFHFRREISTDEHETLSNLRDWMLRKATAADAREQGTVG